MATVKQADQEAAGIGRKFAERIRSLVPEAKIILCGSAARGEMEEFSDIDVYVEIPDNYDIAFIKSEVSDFAWEVGFAFGKIIQAVVYRKSDVWNTPAARRLL